ncbi:MAG: choice-of-anchor J domain-containing protein [Ignavibacteria bacterium]|nr:choice-of-anchor J domain-containing protein [Ignavibacteria bacterium]
MKTFKTASLSGNPINDLFKFLKSKLFPVSLKYFILMILFLSLSNISFSNIHSTQSFTGATFPPTGWTSVHVSGLLGAGTWERATSSYLTAPGCAQSDGTLLGDNWLITSQYTPVSGDSLIFYVSSNYVISALGRLEVKVSTTGTAVGNFLDFVLPLNITLGLLTPNVYYRRAVSLEDYIGTPIYIGFRHIEVAGLFGAVRLDGISYKNDNNPSVLDLTVLMEGHAFFRDRDTVNVDIRSSSSPYQVIESNKVYRDTLGKKTINWFFADDAERYYIVVDHRNSLNTWSRSGGEMLPASVTSYDFTTGLNKAFGNNMKLVNTKATFMTGDINDDEFVDLSDLAAIDNDAFNFVMGTYVITDLNWEEFVDLSDLALCDNNVFIFAMEVQP